MLLLWIIILILSLCVLAKAADYFTDSAERIGSIFKLPQFMTGVLIVSIGTASPELITSIFGVLDGESGILSGNVIGTVIANILLALGLVVVISRRTAVFNWDSVSNDMPFLLGSAILLVLAVFDGKFSFAEAVIFLLGYIIYVIYSSKIRKMNPKEIREDLRKEIYSRRMSKKEKDEIKDKEQKTIVTVLIFIISLIFIILSAHYVVNSVIVLATFLGLGTSILAASVVALGTSLPEISVAISSAKKGHFDLVLGNIMGANIFNILFIFGIVGLFTDLVIAHQVIYFVLPMMIGAILIQWLVTIDKRITITEGLFMTLLYITFIAKLFNLF